MTTLQGEKQLNIIIKEKTSKLTFLTLFGGRVPYSKWVTLTTKRWVKTPIYSSGYTDRTPTLYYESESEEESQEEDDDYFSVGHIEL